MQLQNHYSQFQAQGAQLVALAVASLSSIGRAQDAAGAQYPMLADPDHQAAEAYGVYDLLGDGRAAPAVFVINTDGRILWTYVGQSADDRPAAQEILAQLP